MIPVGSMGTRRNTIRAAGDTVTIQILTEISAAWWSDTSATSVAAVLAENPTATTIKLDINTIGGDVAETFAMITLLQNHPARVITTNLGQALSAGALLMQCGDERRASKHSMQMIHRVWSFTAGNAQELEDQAAVLRQFDTLQVSILSERSTLSADEVEVMLDAETWMVPAVALANGLIDTILDSPAAMACVPAGRFHHTPAALLAQPQPDKAQTMAAEDPKNADKRLADQPDPKFITAAVVADRERAKAIRRSGATLMTSAEVIEAAIEDGDTVAAFHAKAIDLREQAREPHVADGGRAPITANDDQRDKLRDEVSDWLIIKAGLKGKLDKARADRPDIERLTSPVGTGGQFRGSSLVDMVRFALGDAARGRTKSEAIKAFFHAAAGGSNTTADFTIAFENTLHKVMLASYANTPSTWRRFVAIGPPASDFRQQPRYRKGFLSRLDPLNEHGEIKRKSLKDAAKESNALTTRANIVAITREALINDDMGFLSSTAVDLGQAAERTLELIVYELLAQNAGLGPVMSDGKTLFHADHLNIGTGSALSIAALSADILQFKEQRDINNEDFIDLEPTKLLVPTALKFDARKINIESNDFDSGLTVESRNMIAGAFDDVIDSPRLKATSATRRYLFADPNLAPVLEMLFLEGTGGNPTLEAMEQWTMLGREWRIFHDAAVGAIATEGALTNAGV